MCLENEAPGSHKVYPAPGANLGHEGNHVGGCEPG